jgi:hypothetical protein
MHWIDAKVTLVDLLLVYFICAGACSSVRPRWCAAFVESVALDQRIAGAAAAGCALSGCSPSRSEMAAGAS